jgi:hypothetical protein
MVLSPLNVASPSRERVIAVAIHPFESIILCRNRIQFDALDEMLVVVIDD